MTEPIRMIDQHEILWSSRKLTVERATVHEKTGDGGWEVQNVYLVEPNLSPYLLRNGEALKCVQLTKNEARALAAVLLEFARDKP